MKRLSLSMCILAIMPFSLGFNGCEDLMSAEPEEQGQTPGFNYDAEPGTCDGWKVRYCEASVLCGHRDAEPCIYEAEYIACHEDAPYSACEDEFQKVIDEDDCSLFPDDCYPRDIADRTAAQQLCEDVLEAACEFDSFCGFVNVEACINEWAHFYNCDQRLSVVPGGEACVTDLNNAACGEYPSSCLDHTR